jgi:alpha-tubulin suppressor-like RCC1 family protein
MIYNSRPSQIKTTFHRAIKAISIISSLALASCSFSGKITPINSSSSTTNNDGLSVSDKTVVEYGIASLTVSLGKTVSQNVSFTYYTQNQTAASGTDYVGVSGSATIPAGRTQVIISVPVADNYVKTANKTFFFNISSATNAEISRASSIVQIQDDDYNAMTGVTKIAAGATHTCAVATSGGVKCWGFNFSGQLGDGTTTTRILAVDVSGLTSGVSAIATGNGHSCALTTTGGVKCWGLNSNGQLGDGTTTDRTTAVDVTGLTSGVSAIATGNSHSCALTTTGGMKCWGNNGNGRLGDGTTTTRTTAVDVTGLTSGVSAIATGNTHSCALTTTGGVKCWGNNGNGQIGDGTTTQRLTAVDVTGLTSGVSAIATGNPHSCALTTTGGVKCWGNNGNGQIGDGTTTQRTTAVDVTGLTSGVSAIAAGSFHSCAQTTTGGIKCWGDNSMGQLGDGTTTQRTTAVDVTGLTSGVSAIAAGSFHSCALTTTGGMKCWGDNGSGQIGDGNTQSRYTVGDVFGLATGFSYASAGAEHTCALTTLGGVKCWGNNTSGQLGDGTTTNRKTAVDVTGLTSGVSAISAGASHTCALTTLGGVKCWGHNTGDGTTTQRLTAVDVTGLTSGVIAIATGASHSCALTTSGGVKCWGANWSGQIGDGTTTQRNSAVDVTGLTSGVASIYLGYSHTCAVTTSGGVKCWGYNNYGQLGDGTTTQRLTAVDVTGLTSGAVALALGGSYGMPGPSHSCALTTVGGVKCWGYNLYGQLGDGTTTNRITPVDVIGLASGIKSISLGAVHTCALTTTGGIKCWGDNSSGQLGNGTTTQSNVPVNSLALDSGVAAITAGWFQTCVLTTSGGMKCMGHNYYGELGNGYDTTIPQTVVAPP